jgi:hypothetical protein
MTQNGKKVILRSVGGLGFGYSVGKGLFSGRQLGSLALALLDQATMCCSDPGDHSVNHDENR